MDFLKGLKEVSSAASKIGFAVACVAPVVATVVGSKQEQGRPVIIRTQPAPLGPPARCTVWTPPQVCEDRNCRWHQISTERDFSKLR